MDMKKVFFVVLRFALLGVIVGMSLKLGYAKGVADTSVLKKWQLNFSKEKLMYLTSRSLKREIWYFEATLEEDREKALMLINELSGSGLVVELDFLLALRDSMGPDLSSSMQGTIDRANSLMEEHNLKK